MKPKQKKNSLIDQEEARFRIERIEKKIHNERSDVD